MFRLILGVEMVEGTEELVETVGCGKLFIPVAQVVFPELAGHVPLCLEQIGQRRIFLLKTFLCARQADLEKPCAEGALAGDERRTARGTA